MKPMVGSFYPKNHLTLLQICLTLFFAGFWDLQTTSFEIPWFLGLKKVKPPKKKKTSQEVIKNIAKQPYDRKSKDSNFMGI